MYKVRYSISGFVALFCEDEKLRGESIVLSKKAHDPINNVLHSHILVNAREKRSSKKCGTKNTDCKTKGAYREMA